jgi:hypothetical protein
MPSTRNDLLISMFDLAELAEKPQCLCCVYNRTGQAGTLAAPPRDSGDLDGYAATACDLLLQDAHLGDMYVYNGEFTPAQVATRLRVMAYVASVLVPPAVEDYDRRFTLEVDEDGYLPPLDDLTWTLTLAVTELRSYLADYDAGPWVDPNAVAGAVVDLHDAALAVETWWSLNPPAEGADA